MRAIWERGISQSMEIGCYTIDKQAENSDSETPHVSAVPGLACFQPTLGWMPPVMLDFLAKNRDMCKRDQKPR